MATTLLPLLLVLAVQDPTAVPSRIAEVTVYAGSASVKRTAALPAGGGSFVLAGLPRSIDPSAIRVQCTGAEVMGVEMRDRFQREVPEARVTALKDRVRELERDVATLEDDDSVLARLEGHLDELMWQEERAHRAELEQGKTDPDVWEASYAYFNDKLASISTERRELRWRTADARAALQDARLELGRFESSGGVHVRDLIVDVVDTSGGEANLALEYVVGNAGWAPQYDLRAPKDLSRVELVYRARVWQRTGEDWADVDVLLSTAQPHRGAQGPELEAEWLRLREQREDKGVWRLGADAAPMAEPVLEESELEEGRISFDAEVFDEGLSVRFRLARKETIESRDQPSLVLVGRADLDITPEHVCVPALDTTVWLRARATNTSDWVMLPGRAAVYFGADFIGHAELPAVQKQEELTLHLGPDPGLLVERTQLEDLTEESGLFSSRKTLQQSWRIRVANNGAFTAARDGSVAVLVHEVLPRATDDRVTVEIEKAKPALATSARWAKEREEKGVLTWSLRVPKGGQRVIELATSIAYPEDMRLVFD